MAAFGPDARTLCGEWTVRDLAAHLVIRERRPDTAPGILIPQLESYTEGVRRKAAARPFQELLDEVRDGPPLWSPLWAVDSLVNTTEMFVHHEDVRRGSPGWEPRTLDPADEGKLWSTVRKMGRMSYRKAAVQVTLATPDGERVTVHRSGAGEVVLTGAPSELLLHAFGRDEVEIEMSGSPADVESIRQLDRSV